MCMVSSAPKWNNVILSNATKLLIRMIRKNEKITSLEFKEKLRNVVAKKQYKLHYNIVQSDVSKFLCRAWDGMYIDHALWLGYTRTLDSSLNGETFFVYKPEETNDEYERRNRHEDLRLGAFT